MTEAPIGVGPNEGTVVPSPLGGNPITFKVRGDQTDGAMFAFENEVVPGEGPPLHTHAREAEVLYVLEGDFRFLLGEEEFSAPPGSMVFVPRGAPHTWQNAGASPGRMLIVFTPAGMEGFFERFAEADDPGPEAFRRLGAEMGMDVIGPPLGHPGRG